MALQLLQKNEQQSVAWWHFQQLPARHARVSPSSTAAQTAGSTHGRRRARGPPGTPRRSPPSPPALGRASQPSQSPAGARAPRPAALPASASLGQSLGLSATALWRVCRWIDRPLSRPPPSASDNQSSTHQRSGTLAAGLDCESRRMITTRISATPPLKRCEASPTSLGVMAMMVVELSKLELCASAAHRKS